MKPAWQGPEERLSWRGPWSLSPQPAISKENSPSLDSRLVSLETLSTCVGVKVGRVKISFISFKKNSPLARCRQRQKPLFLLHVPLAASREALRLFNTGKGTVTYLKCNRQSSQNNRLISREESGCQSGKQTEGVWMTCQATVATAGRSPPLNTKIEQSRAPPYSHKSLLK